MNKSSTQKKPVVSAKAAIQLRDMPAVWQRLAPDMRQQEFHKGDPVIHHGDPATSMWLVRKGWVKLTRQTPDGKETVVGLCTEGDVFGEAALFPKASYPYHAEVIDDGSVLSSIPTDVLRRAVADDAEFSKSVMSTLGERIIETQLKLEHMSTMSTAQRLGCFLLYLCKDHADNESTLRIPVEKHILAAYLGMKPETLSRSQQQLKCFGVEVSGAQVVLRDIEKLRDFVCNSCSESGNCKTECAGQDS